MTFLLMLYLLGELGTYYAFAGIFSYRFGGYHCLLSLLVLTLCYGASYLLREKKFLRFVPVVFILLYAFLVGSLADRIALIPSAGLTILKIWRKSYDLIRYRQEDLFSVLTKGFLLVGIFACVLGMKDAVLLGGLPIALATAIVQVYLLRTLRHDPAVYRDSSFLWRSGRAFLVPVIAALLFALSGAATAAWKAAGAVYQGTVVPLLTPFVYLAAWFGEYVIGPLVRLWYRLYARLGERTGAVQSDNAGAGSELSGALEEADTGIYQMVGTVLLVVLVVSVVALLIWLAIRYVRNHPRKEETPVQPGLEVTRETVIPEEEQTHDEVWRVRRAYRSYLRQVAKQGTDLTSSDTSLDVLEKTNSDPEAEELRQLYLNARYNSSADGEAVRRAKRLARRLSKQ